MERLEIQSDEVSEIPFKRQMIVQISREIRSRQVQVRRCMAIIFSVMLLSGSTSGFIVEGGSQCLDCSLS